jgi:CDP-4-dehydro-6-deoxyglucose reductase, E3
MASMSGSLQLGTAKATVVSSRILTPRARLVRLLAERPLDFCPGHYVGLARPEADCSPHYFSIASAPTIASALNPKGASEFELCMGFGTTSFQEEISPGDELVLLGPFGQAVSPRPEATGALLIATGTGVGLVRSCLRAGLWGHHRAIVIVGHRSQDEALFYDEFSSMTNVDYRPVFSQPSAGWRGRVGYVQDAVSEALEQDRTPRLDAVVCGHKPMVSEVVSRLSARGVSEPVIFAQGY